MIELTAGMQTSNPNQRFFNFRRFLEMTITFIQSSVEILLGPKIAENFRQIDAKLNYNSWLDLIPRS